MSRAAKEYDVRGYIQTSYHDITNNDCKKVFDVCCQGIPTVLVYLLECIHGIQGVLLIDCNFVYRSTISSKFIIKPTLMTDITTCKREVISVNDDGPVCNETVITSIESVFSLNTFTISKANLAHIKVEGMLPVFLLTVINTRNCPPLIIQVLSLYMYQEFRASVCEIICDIAFTSFPKLLLPVLNNPKRGAEPSKSSEETFWSEFIEVCSRFLQNNQRARHIVLCSSIK
ncbi:predicted protein [Naegleria gruberi]|uniref:Predicted protein n=1 Tax=Naegleria gruberi TaxID=5762 RepID=D2VTN2_NAEGR|nr:uncharacterized protein NAEGRDRAFT_72362 [Naegleria gruberi]EFC39680.1 predicted protein [Naegleria gruberi]|eukprot:XP_002672424.1 predicted protein [Naegleria gruberi strain NEG-M]